MASATEALNGFTPKPYETGSPLNYSTWVNQQELFDSSGDFEKGWNKFWKTGNYSQENYDNYLNDFYNKQSIRNAAISEENQRAYESLMSSTAYKRAYDDLLKTGLNPAMILSSLNPASTPSSASNVGFNSSSSRSSSRSSSESKSSNNSATAVLAALIFLLARKF